MRASLWTKLCAAFLVCCGSCILATLSGVRLSGDRLSGDPLSGDPLSGDFLNGDRCCTYKWFPVLYYGSLTQG